MANNRRAQILSGCEASEEPLLRSKRPRSRPVNLAEFITREVDRLSDHRAETRYPAPARARSVNLAGRSVLIKDISASGLQVESNVHGEIGAHISVAFPNFPEMGGRIVWIRASTVGLELPRDAIDLTEVE